MMARLLTLVVLVGATFGFALTVINLTYEHRRQVALLGELGEEQGQLKATHDRLQLDRATWATPTRIESYARTQLGMIAPGERELRR